MICNVSLQKGFMPSEMQHFHLRCCAELPLEDHTETSVCGRGQIINSSLGLVISGCQMFVSIAEL